MALTFLPRPLKWRPLWLAMGWALVIAVTVISLWPRLPKVPVGHFDKFGHFTAYFILMAWFGFLYLRGSHVLIASALVALGVVLEVAQHFTGYRVFEVADIGVNMLGVVMAAALARATYARA